MAFFSQPLLPVFFSRTLAYSTTMQSPSIAPQHPYYNLHLIRHTASSSSQVSIPRPMSRDERVRFALFVKILFKRLDESGELTLCHKAKCLLLCVTARHRQGDPGCRPLIETLERRLRATVGETHWRRAHLLMRLYLSRNKHVLPSSSGFFHKISYAA